MAHAPEPPFEELLWTISVARLLFGPSMNIQAPPNLTSGRSPQFHSLPPKITSATYASVTTQQISIPSVSGFSMWDV